MSLDLLREMLEERPIRRTGELSAAGINSRTIQQAIDAKIAVRPEMISDKGALPGIIASYDAEIEPGYDDALAMMLVPGGVIARRTAAMRHGLATGLPPVIEVLTAHSVTRVPEQANVHLMRSRRAAALTEGVADVPNTLGVRIRMTTPARTVVDLFRSGQKVPGDLDTAYAALASYLSKGEPGAEIVRLCAFFEEGVRDSVEKAVYAATESLTKGYLR